MKPSCLRAGMCVRRVDRPDSPPLVFVHRCEVRRQSTLQCDSYRGQGGPDDAGYVQISDWDMSRKYVRAQVAA